MESPCASVFPSVGGWVDKSRNSALETLKRAVNAVRDFLFSSATNDE